MISIYWFKRDLRVDDNRALFEAFKYSKKIIPIFIFDPFILKKFNSFDHRLYFIYDILKNLSKKIKIYCFYDKTENVFKKILKENKVDTVFTAKSFSWSGELRDLKVKKILNSYKVKFVEIFDNYLADFTKIPYTKVYSYFYKKWLLNLDLKIVDLSEINFNQKVLKLNYPFVDKLNDLVNFERFKTNYWNFNFLIERLKNFDFKNYEAKRNNLAEDGTSKISPFIRFGVISLRQLYLETKNKSEAFIKELAWREFFYHIKNYFFQMKNLEFQEKRRNLKWKNNENYLKSFMNVQTGYPLIDAAIIQLKKENWMHNRARMIVGSFLTKNLLIDWRIGEEFFSRYLIDYDEVVNVGNWQWVSSVGPDPKPFRIFNPILQAKKFDPDAFYIKKYLPEFYNEKPYKLFNPLRFKLDYYPPIINIKESYYRAKKFYLTKY